MTITSDDDHDDAFRRDSDAAITEDADDTFAALMDHYARLPLCEQKRFKDEQDPVTQELMEAAVARALAWVLAGIDGTAAAALAAMAAD